MTSEQLATLSGIVLSLIFSYVPGIKNWFEGLDGNYKRLVMLVVLFLTAAGVLAAGCLGYYDAVSCDVAGIFKMLEIFILAAIANQTAYALTPKKDNLL